MAGTVDQTIATKYNEIKSQAYAKSIVSEDVIERNYGYKIIRETVSGGRNSLIYKCESAKHREVNCIVKPYKLGKDKVRLSLKEETCQILRFVSGKCPQLVSTYDIFYTSEKLYMMCDWTSRGEVLANLRDRSLKLTEEMLRNWSLDMLSAVNFLHNNGICHRNISPGCLLLTADNRVKIGTLSDAVIYCKADGTLIKQKWSKFSRSANWNQPPEVAKGKLYDGRRADLWSIGATVFWFITKQHPIDYASNSRLNKQLENRMSLMLKVTRRCQAFVKQVLTYQPSKRLSIAEAMQLDWITLEHSKSPKEITEAATEITTAEKTQEPGDAAGPDETPAPAESTHVEAPSEA